MSDTSDSETKVTSPRKVKIVASPSKVQKPKKDRKEEAPKMSRKSKTSDDETEEVPQSPPASPKSERKTKGDKGKDSIYERKVGKSGTVKSSKKTTKSGEENVEEEEEETPKSPRTKADRNPLEDLYKKLPPTNVMAKRYVKNPHLVGPFFMVTIGKYKGKNAMEMVEMEANGDDAAKRYVAWLFGETGVQFFKIQESMKVVKALRFEYFVRLFRKTAPASERTPQDQLMQFGKYKGELFSTIFTNDPKYCKNLAEGYPIGDFMAYKHYKAKMFWDMMLEGEEFSDKE